MDRVEKTISDLKNVNLYSILEIHKTDDQNAIKKAYKKLIKKYHPDKNKEENTVEKFDRIKIAYDLLKNEELKALYDSKLKSKEERKANKKLMSEKRRKFAEDLENKEKSNADKSHRDSNNKQESDYFKEKNLYKQYEEEYNKMFSNNQFEEEIPKRKTLTQKLNQYGIKIKWKNDMGVIFTKDVLKIYFKEFGTIEEIILKENDNKALLLFNNEKAIKDILNSSNHIIHKLFRIKKYSKKVILEEKQINLNLKNKFLDTETINLLRNKQFMSNLNYMQDEKNKSTTTNKQDSKIINKNDHNLFQEDVLINSDENNKANVNLENMNFDLDLDSMEKLLFERISKKK